VKPRALPRTAELPPPFPPPFRALLQLILARSARFVGGRVETARARRRQLAQSGVFTGHRPYVTGDDLRHIDWNAYARHGGLFVKLLEEDERRATSIVLDCSRSMLAGSPSRWTGALRQAAILGGLALLHLDELQLCTGSAPQAFSGRAAVPQLLAALTAAQPNDVLPLPAVQELLRRGPAGKVLWLSDFAEPALFEPALLLLRRAGVRTTGWQPRIADDVQVARRGLLRLCDPETGAELVLPIDDELAVAMQAELQLLARAQEHLFAHVGYPLQRFTLPAADDFRLASWMETAWSHRR